MFAIMKTFLALLALASFARAISIEPVTLIGNSTFTIKWTFSDSDPGSFDIELIHKSFNTQYALGNNVETATGSFTGELPVVPVDSAYAIEFVDIGNINNIIAQISPISVVEHDASSPLPSTFPATTAPISTAIPSTPLSISTTITQLPSTESVVEVTPTIPAAVTGTSSSPTSSPSSFSGAIATSSFGSHGYLVVLVAGAFALAF